MIVVCCNILQHSGTYHVSSSGPERAALTSLLSCTNPRSKPVSLFRSAPYNYQPRNDSKPPTASSTMDAVGSVSLPSADWSELTFFAPHALPLSTVSSGASIGSRTYICQRHTQPHGSSGPQQKIRICTSTLLQA
jgi:hypothetical protein